MDKQEFLRKWEHLFDLVKEISSTKDNESSNEMDNIPLMMLRDAISVIEGDD